MNTQEAIVKGIGAHGMWKQRLIDAIKTGKSEWTPQLVCQDNQCEFGKWLYSCSHQEKSSPHYSNVKKLHAEFHKKAAEVLTLALNNKKNDAEKEIAPGSQYHTNSGKLTREMMAWKAGFS